MRRDIYTWNVKVGFVGREGVGKSTILESITSPSEEGKGVYEKRIDFHDTEALTDAEIDSYKLWITIYCSPPCRPEKLEDCDGGVVVVDLSDEQSVKMIGQCVNRLRKYGKDGLPIILVGNKFEDDEKHGKLLEKLKKKAKRWKLVKVVPVPFIHRAIEKEEYEFGRVLFEVCRGILFTRIAAEER